MSHLTRLPQRSDADALSRLLERAEQHRNPFLQFSVSAAADVADVVRGLAGTGPGEWTAAFVAEGRRRSAVAARGDVEA